MRGWLRDDLLALVQPDMDRRIASSRIGERPAVILVVGVNGTGKTTTVGKLARVLVAEDREVLLGAADTFRAAAADQLETWGARVGVATVRSDKDGADPAAVAFDAVKAGIEEEVDVVIIDTAGRLHNKVGLMDELGKVKRVLEKQSPIDEVLLVLDATTGQNGLQQAKVFSEAVDDGICASSTAPPRAASSSRSSAAARCAGQARRPRRGPRRPLGRGPRISRRPAERMRSPIPPAPTGRPAAPVARLSSAPGPGGPAGAGTGAGPGAGTGSVAVAPAGVEVVALMRDSLPVGGRPRRPSLRSDGVGTWAGCPR